LTFSEGTEGLLTNPDEIPPAARVLLAIGNPKRERELREHVVSAGFVIVERCLDGPSLAERALRLDADVALASSDLHRLSNPTLLSIREARLPLVLLADQDDFERYTGFAHIISNRCTPAEALHALRQAQVLGANYTEVSPDRAGRASLGESGDSETGRVLALVGGKGAPGVTTVAIGLASSLAQMGRRVVLVDADLRVGNVVPYLDLDPSHGVLGLAVARQGTASLPVEDELQDGPGFRVLAGLERPEAYAALTPELVGSAVTRLRQLAHYVLIDAGQITAATSSAVGEAAVRSADGVLLVAGADLVGAWNAQCCVRHLTDGLGLASASVAVVVNRYEKRGQYSQEDIEQALGTEVVGLVPEDRRSARRALSEQLPINEAGGKVARALRDITAQLANGQTAAPAKPAGRRWPLRLKTSMAGKQ
jgi:flagellar biosynthesis protein FlhG